jgi:hypothetical protein
MKTMAKKTARKALAAQTQMTFRDAAMAPKHWLLTGTALKIGLFATLSGVVALPASTALACDAPPATSIACGSGGGGYVGTGAVTTETRLEVVAGGKVTTGVDINNGGNTADFHVYLDAADPVNTILFPAATVSGGPTYNGIGITTSGDIDVHAATGTSVNGGTGNHDGYRLRTTGNGTITVDSAGNVTAGSNGTNGGEAIDAQSAGGTVQIKLHGGTYTGLKSQTIVAAATGGHVDVNVGADEGDSAVTVTGATTGSNKHGIWVSRSLSTNVDVENGSVTANDASTGIMVGYDGAGSTATSAYINLGADGSVIGGTGISVNSTADGSTYNNGNVNITNHGHLQGTAGSGAIVKTAGDVTGSNDSYGSWIGTVDGLEATGDSFDFDNSGGLVFGATRDGLNIHDIAGGSLDPEQAAVYVDNRGHYFDSEDYSTGGIIAGQLAGIAVNDVKAGDVVIDNGGYLNEDGIHYASGGLIAGRDGIYGDDLAGSVYINNENTNTNSTTGDSRFASVALDDTHLDTSFTTAAAAYITMLQTAGYTTGIFGETAIDLSDIDGAAIVNNSSGVIAGINGDAIHVDGADGNLSGAGAGLDPTDPRYADPNIGFILNNGQSDKSTVAGLVWGSDDAVDLNDIDGDVLINNGNGTTYGDQRGLNIHDVWQGDVDIFNNGGTIQGLYDDGIHIRDVDHGSEDGGHVVITNGGAVYGGDSAISISNADSVQIGNGFTDMSENVHSGAIIGDGSWNEPVISLRNIADGGTAASTVIDNNAYSVIGSSSLPGTTLHWTAPNPTKLPGWALNTARLEDDVNAMYDFVNGSTPDSTQLTALADWSDAANDMAVRSSQGGATTLNNHSFSLLVGRVNLDGRNGAVGNTINNDGTWVVTGKSELHGTADNDVINNHGLIQAALDGSDFETTSFTSDHFNNDGGVISMLDGHSGDRTYIHGDYDGSGAGALAIDVNLATGYADQLRLRDGTVTGQTGVIVRLVDSGGSLGDRIEFANYDNTAASDAFVLDQNSDNFVSTSNGGMIADGLLGWYVQQDNYNGFDLVADWGPGAYNAPGVVTGAQTAFYSGLGMVEDHVYGGQFKASGGGGADLPQDEPVAVADPTTTDVAIWGKISGDRTSRSSTVTLTPPGTTLSTTSNENAYSVLGGADYTPGGADFRAGVFGGYTGASKDFNGAGTDATYNGGTVGGYAAYNNGSFYADVTGKADFYGVTYNFAGSSATASALNLGVDANVGYRLDMGGAYVEPIGSLVAVNTRVSDVTGINFSDGTSVRVGAGGRIGTQIVSGELTTDLSLLGKVWDEMGKPNTAVVTDGVNTVTTTDKIAGVFGELGATAAFSSPGSSVSGFVTATSTFGANQTSYGAKGGLRFDF